MTIGKVHSPECQIVSTEERLRQPQILSGPIVMIESDVAFCSREKAVTESFSILLLVLRTKVFNKALREN
jgi:hypothetical protein